ncbi:MAG: DEAD/DEAH box helicase [Alphaproteobacteria bacterium]|nr:DEAD/DEAH box helicase [Alphaproteobacteria bacterium]
MEFQKLGLSPLLCESVRGFGYTQPTPIQEQAIPYVLRGQDVLGCAQTGTGKTASFLLPLIQLLLESPGRARLSRAVILEPTRELATQVLDNFKNYCKNIPLSAVLLVGGESFSDQEKALQQGADVLIATPGRLLDLINRGKIMMIGTKYAVIDEADRMLDMGFIPDVDRILAGLSPQRQTLLFSATLSPEIRKLANTYLVNPQEITVAPTVRTAITIQQFSVSLPTKQKPQAVQALLKKYGKGISSLIFCNRKRDISILVTTLKRYGFKVEALHGDLSQSTRNQALASLKQKDLDVLVASDVAARGLDIEDLDIVINYDVPINVEDYVHRIGRTGRAGQQGQAFTLVSDPEKKQWAAIETFTHQKIDEYVLVLEDEEPKKEKRGPQPKKETARAKSEEPALVTDDSAHLPSSDSVPFLPSNSAHLSSSGSTRGSPKNRKDLRPRGDVDVAEKATQTAAPTPRARTPYVRHNTPFEDRSVIGFGEHLPDFMARPVPLLNLSQGLDLPQEDEDLCAPLA